MNAEITKLKDMADVRGWLLYDGDCPICTASANRIDLHLTRRGFDLAPLQSSWVQECLDISVPNAPTEMLLLTTDGELFGGAHALLYLARFVWWAWPLSLLRFVPGVPALLQKIYLSLAARRHCVKSACAVKHS